MSNDARITDYVSDQEMKSILDKALFSGQQPELELTPDMQAVFDKKMRKAAEEISEGLRRDANSLSC